MRPSRKLDSSDLLRLQAYLRGTAYGRERGQSRQTVLAGVMLGITPRWLREGMRQLVEGTPTRRRYPVCTSVRSGHFYAREYGDIKETIEGKRRVAAVLFKEAADLEEAWQEELRQRGEADQLEISIPKGGTNGKHAADRRS